MGKTKEQMAEDKKIAMSFRVKPLELEGLDAASLKSEVNKLWERYVILETEKYDLEVRASRQDYDVRHILKSIILIYKS